MSNPPWVRTTAAASDELQSSTAMSQSAGVLKPNVRYHILMSQAVAWVQD